jgi:hypothetical protein
MTGPAAELPPVPEALKPLAGDKQTFTGGVWMMQSGSWQVRLYAAGAKGSGVVSVPVPSVARGTKKMQTAMGVALSLFGLFLVVGVIAIVGASAREAQLAEALSPGSAERTRARRAMAIASVLAVAALAGGWVWWDAEAADYGRYIYKPLAMDASVNDGALTVQVKDPGWVKQRRLDDLVPDHDHLMHLYAVRMPQMDAVYHLHPEQAEPGVFRIALPKLEPGRYQLFADIVHASGFPETIVGAAEVPANSTGPLKGDDAGGVVKARGSALDSTYVLPDGYRLVWERPAELKAKAPETFRFKLVDAQERPAHDMQLYMGMLGHAAFLRTDAPGTVFAHVHPAGSVAMPALDLAQKQNETSGGKTDAMPGMHMASDPSLPNEVGFPYGFSTAGSYRIIVQMKHSGTVETAVFDADVK